jgi:hypothetical protein
VTRAVILSDVGTGVVAIIDDASGGGAFTDSAALRNRPAVDPGNWLAENKFNSELDYYELVGSVYTTTVTHAALTGGLTQNIEVAYNAYLRIYGQHRQTDIPIYTHGLGYVPSYMIALGGSRLPAGIPTQVGADWGAGRLVSHWADATNIYLHEDAFSGSTTLAAQALTYQVMVFAQPVADPDVPPLFFDNATGVLKLGRGKVRSDRHYLRKALSGESSFDINLGVTGALSNGAIKVVSGGNVYAEPGFTASFPGPAYVPVSGVF